LGIPGLISKGEDKFGIRDRTGYNYRTLVIKSEESILPLPSQSALTTARRLFAEHGRMLRTTEAIHLGIHPRDLYSLRDHGEVEEVARGLYRLAQRTTTDRS